MRGSKKIKTKRTIQIFDKERKARVKLKKQYWAKRKIQNIQKLLTHSKLE